MIMSSYSHNRNVPSGRMAAGGQDGWEITYGTEGIAERKSYGTGEALPDEDTGSGKRTESKLPAGTADICRL
jgi:hypothetical protein